MIEKLTDDEYTHIHVHTNARVDYVLFILLNMYMEAIPETYTKKYQLIFLYHVEFQVILI